MELWERKGLWERKENGGKAWRLMGGKGNFGKEQNYGGPVELWESAGIVGEPGESWETKGIVG